LIQQGWNVKMKHGKQKGLLKSKAFPMPSAARLQESRLLKGLDSV
jgi:hypothetical protein